MKSIGKWMLAAVVIAGGLGLGTAKANAQFGVYVRAGRPAAYVPACPGPGYAWVNGYYDGYGQYIQGYWNFEGVQNYAPTVGVYYGYRGGDRDWDRNRDWDRDRRNNEYRNNEYRNNEYREHAYREHDDRGDHRGGDRDRR